MDYKKKYKEAQKWIEKIYPTLQHEQQMEAEAFFPELKESEDERVRKNIIATIHLYYGEPLEDEAKEMIAWLEKQGDKKTTDKVEPFDQYEGLTDFERTLADICIGWIGEELGWKQYIKDNADVLLKIAIKKFNSVQDVPFEQKHAWSEEDEEILRTIISDGIRGAEFDMLQINWLKSLKQRIGWKPSEEQIECLYDAINHYQTNGYPASKLNELYEQMSKIYKL